MPVLIVLPHTFEIKISPLINRDIFESSNEFMTVGSHNNLVLDIIQYDRTHSL